MTPDVNLLDGAWYAGDPSPMYARLRAEAPVYWDPVNELWGISRYADVVEVEKHAVRYSSSSGSRPKIVGDVSSINNDDPLHQNKRRLVARRFTPKSVKEHENHVRAVVNELVDAVIARGECNVVEAFAAPLPARMIGELLGFEPDLWPKCLEWSEVTMYEGGQYAADGSVRETAPRTISAVLEFATATLETIAARRAAPSRATT